MMRVEALAPRASLRSRPIGQLHRFGDRVRGRAGQHRHREHAGADDAEREQQRTRSRRRSAAAPRPPAPTIWMSVMPARAASTAVVSMMKNAISVRERSCRPGVDLDARRCCARTCSARSRSGSSPRRARAAPRLPATPARRTGTGLIVVPSTATSSIRYSRVSSTAAASACAATQPRPRHVDREHARRRRRTAPASATSGSARA